MSKEFFPSTEKEQGPPQEKIVERPPAPEEIKLEKSWNDENGERICEVEAILDGEPYSINNRPSKMLKALFLRGEHGGKPIEIDVLAMTGATGENPTASRILIADQRHSNYYFYRETKTVSAPPLETPVDFAVLLHELGHAKQKTEPRYAEVNEQYKRSIEDLEDPTKRDAIIESWKKNVPGLDPESIDARMAGWDTLRNEVQKKKNETQAAKQELDKLLGELNTVRYEALKTEPNFRAFYEELDKLSGGYSDPSMEQAEAFLSKYGAKIESMGDDPLFADLPGVGDEVELTENERKSLLSKYGLQDLRRALGKPTFYTESWETPTAKLTRDELSLKFEIAVAREDEKGTILENRIMRVHLPVHAEPAPSLVDEQLDERLNEAERKHNTTIREMAEAKETMFDYLKESGLEGTLDLPRKILERDANGKAMKWLHDLKLGGIDLFKAMPSETAPTLTEECSTTDPVKWTVPEILRHSVKSYRASVGELRKAKGKPF